MNSVRIAKDFFKHVPMEKQELVLSKLETFSKSIIEANVFHEIPKGFWIRKIAGTSIYKFRVNSGDRILFTFKEDGIILFLSYETHDKQIRAAKGMNKQTFIEFVINENAYDEELIDEEINRYALQELIGKLNLVSQHEIMEDEYVTLLLEDDELFTSDQILTREQYEALNTPSKLTIIFGCAGSGKTNIGIRRLLLHQELNIPTLYVSHSPYLKNETQRQFLEKATSDLFIQFFSLQNLYEHVLMQSFTLATKDDFMLWCVENNLQNNITPYELFLEINTVIKGQTLQKMMTQEQYYSYPSDFSVQEKRNIYFVASLYQKWLQKNHYYDLNDLAFMVLQGNKLKLESIVFDEIQELTHKQFESLLHVSKSPARNVLLGDPYQAIDNYAFHTEQIDKALASRHVPYKKYVLNKNFRSGLQVVQLLNHIKEQEITLDPSVDRLDEIAIRSTSSPKLVIQNQWTDHLLQDLDKDVNSIIIVPTLEAKKTFQNKGFHRVFVVSEVQGLQYKNIYCQDILQYFSQVDQSSYQLYKTYYHLMYVAASRTSQNIYFLESDYPRNLSRSFFDEIEYEQLLKMEYGSTPLDAWLQEARKLELLGKFEQALDAYKKAQNQEGQIRCQALLLRSKNYKHLETFLSFIHFDFEIMNQKHIEDAFQLLKSKSIQMIGRTTYFITQTNGQIIFNPFFIEPGIDIHQISQEMYRRINFSYAAKHTLHIAGVFYKDNKPILLSEEFDKNHLNDIRFFIKNNKVNYQLSHLSKSRQHLKHYSEFEKNKHPKVNKALEGFNVDIAIVNAKEKKKETAEDFLNDIFK